VRVDLDATAAAIERAFPDLADIRPCRLLGSGFHNTAIETAAGIVFRLGNDESGPERYAQEFRVLPALSELVPAPIPVPRWFIERSDDFPRGVIGYRKIQGEAFEPGQRYPNALAKEIAAFLVALHTIPVEKGRAIGLRYGLGRRGYEETWARVKPVLRDRLSGEEHARLGPWWEGFTTEDSLFEYEPAVIHTDIWQENILVDGEGHLAGVLDFDHIGIGDAAQDIATLGHLGAEFAEAAREHYVKARPDLDQHFHHRVQRLWEFRELEGIDWAIEMDNAEELDDAIRKLRTGPIFR
jgi:aminoglycoside 2''-phosphotransferase